jgi:flavin-dependent dehydrogenase
MNEIAIRAEMTLQEYYACQDALLSRKGVKIVLWTVLAIGAAFLASSAALTFGTTASILAGAALATLIFSYFLGGQITAERRRQAYRRYRESNTSYIFTNERIVATSRYAESSIAWAGVDRVREMKTVYLLTIGNWYICVPKRDIPPDSFGDFIQLLRTRGLLRQA